MCVCVCMCESSVDADADLLSRASHRNLQKNTKIVERTSTVKVVIGTRTTEMTKGGHHVMVVLGCGCVRPRNRRLRSPDDNACNARLWASRACSWARRRCKLLNSWALALHKFSLPFRQSNSANEVMASACQWRQAHPCSSGVPCTRAHNKRQ